MSDTEKKWREFWTDGIGIIYDEEPGLDVQEFMRECIRVIEHAAYEELKAENERLNRRIIQVNGFLYDANEELTAERAKAQEYEQKYNELLSYMPKVPTQPYEKELAQQCAEFREALEKIAGPELFNSRIFAREILAKHSNE